MAVEHDPGTRPGDRSPASTTSATAPTTARDSAAPTPARSLYSQSLRGSYGLGRSAKSKVLPMLLFAVMCVPAPIMVAVSVATKAKELPRRVHALRDHHAGGHRPLRRLAGTAGRLPRPALQDRPAVLLAPDRDRGLRPGEVRGPGLGPVPPHRGCRWSCSTWARCWPSSTSPTRPRDSLQGLVSVALLSLLFAGIGLVIVGGHPAPRLRRRRRHRRPDHLLRRGVHASRPSPTRRAARVPSPGSASSRPITLIDGVQTAFLGATSAFPGGVGPRHRRRRGLSCSSSSDSSPAATAC